MPELLATINESQCTITTGMRTDDYRNIYFTTATALTSWQMEATLLRALHMCFPKWEKKRQEHLERAVMLVCQTRHMPWPRWYLSPTRAWTLFVLYSSTIEVMPTFWTLSSATLLPRNSWQKRPLQSKRTCRMWNVLSNSSNKVDQPVNSATEYYRRFQHDGTPNLRCSDLCSTNLKI